MNIKRDKLVIVADVLRMANAGMQKTRILSEAGMSSEMLNRYLQLMLNARLLEEVSINAKVGFRTSRKGAEFLQFFYELLALLKTEEDGRCAAYNGVQLPPSVIQTELLRR